MANITYSISENAAPTKSLEISIDKILDNPLTCPSDISSIIAVNIVESLLQKRVISNIIYTDDEEKRIHIEINNSAK